MREGTHCIPKGLFKRALLRAAGNSIEALIFPCKLLVDLVEATLIARINKQPAYLVEKVVASCSGNRPVVWKCFASAENFLRHDKAGMSLLKPPEILPWIQKPIGMIDAQSANFPFSQQLAHERVRRGENLR